VQHLLSFFLLILCISPAVVSSEEKKLEPLNASYPSVTGNMAPLWIAKEKRLFEKHGLEVKLVNISSGVVSINALIGGDIQIAAASGSSAVAAAARGAPLAIVATFGPTPYKLVARSDIRSIADLKGKVVGTSRAGSGSDFALRRLLSKLKLVPGKDVTLLPTGLSESDKRIAVMLQGKIDATIAAPDSIAQFELKGEKIGVLADLLEMGIYTSGSVLAATRPFLNNRRSAAKSFLAAFSEGIWIGRTDREQTYEIFRKYLRVGDPAQLDVLRKTSILDRIPPKPYPQEEAVQADLEDLAAAQPALRAEIKAKKPSDFIDGSLLKELERENFFLRLYNK
jgi:NitT/TauT family transport system substrate-binding protein